MTGLVGGSEVKASQGSPAADAELALSLPGSVSGGSLAR